MPVEMTPAMEAAALLGIAERELKISIGEAGAHRRVIHAVSEYIDAVDHLLETIADLTWGQ